MKLDKESLLLYEAPAITEFISIGWMQTLLAKWLAWKVSRKIDRWNKRIDRANYLKSKGFI